MVYFLRQCDFLKDWKQTIKLVLKIIIYTASRKMEEKLFPNLLPLNSIVLREWRRNQHSKKKENQENLLPESLKEVLKQKGNNKRRNLEQQKKQKTSNMIIIRKSQGTYPKTPRTTEFSKIMGYNIKINYFKTKSIISTYQQWTHGHPKWKIQ